MTTPAHALTDAELIERLRAPWITGHGIDITLTPGHFTEAADRLASLSAQVEALTKERDELRREFDACEGALKNSGNVCRMRTQEVVDYAAQVEALKSAIATDHRIARIAHHALNAAPAPAEREKALEEAAKIADAYAEGARMNAKGETFPSKQIYDASETMARIIANAIRALSRPKEG